MSSTTPLRGLSAPEDHLRPADAFMHEIADSIVSGRYAVGEALPPEAPLGLHFRVSRTIIRESMKRLQEKGLVAIQQGRGTLVRPRSEWNVLDPLVLSVIIAHDEENHTLDELTLIRASLEGLMAGQAADATTAAEHAELAAALERMKDAAAEYSRFRDADADFHRLVMKQSGNLLASNIADTLYSRARHFARFEGTPDANAADYTLEQHRAIYDAIAAGDGPRAHEAMRVHILDAWRRRSGHDLV
ncbi:MAG: FCD domain-containing protein [Leifsonia sp.]|jgi:DNA-binding FadR family transcriptional regulator